MAAKHSTSGANCVRRQQICSFDRAMHLPFHDSDWMARPNPTFIPTRHPSVRPNDKIAACRGALVAGRLRDAYLNSNLCWVAKNAPGLAILKQVPHRKVADPIMLFRLPLLDVWVRRQSVKSVPN